MNIFYARDMKVKYASEVPVRDRLLFWRIQLLLKPSQDHLSTLAQSPKLHGDGDGL